MEKLIFTLYSLFLFSQAATAADVIYDTKAAKNGQIIPSFVMMIEFSAWAPGRPEKSKQILVWENGTGQIVGLANHRVVSLANFLYDNKTGQLFPVGSFFDLRDNYETPIPHGLIVEGRKDKTLFVFHANGRSKFISAENELLPQALIDFRQKLPTTTVEHTGSFISVRLQPESAIADFRDISIPVMDTESLKDYPELCEALASPFKFVAIDTEKWPKLLASLKLSPAAVFAKTITGNIVRIEFYR